MTIQVFLKLKNPLPDDSHSASQMRSGLSSESHPAMDVISMSSFVSDQDDNIIYL